MMRKVMAYVAPMLLGVIMSAAPAAAQMGGMGGGMGGMGGGGGVIGAGVPPAEEDAPDDSHPAPYQGPHQIKPVSLEKFDKVVTAMFNMADLNHDGMVTLAELQQIVTQRRDQIIRSRFNEIDSNHDGKIDLAEFMAWQQDMGSAASSKCSAYADQAEIVPESLGPVLGSGEEDEALAIAVEPLSALLITKANIHYRPGLTLEDLLAYENARFNAADTNHDGFLEQSEVEALLHQDKTRNGVNWGQPHVMLPASHNGAGGK